MKNARTCRRCWALEDPLHGGFYCQLHYPVRTACDKHSREPKPEGPCPKPLTGTAWLAERKKAAEAAREEATP